MKKRVEVRSQAEFDACIALEPYRQNLLAGGGDDYLTLEIWKPIPGFHAYEASNLGRVRSLDRLVTGINRHGPVTQKRRGKMLKAGIGPHGYYQVTLSRNGERFQRTVHSLVADAFLGLRAAGMLVLHKDGDRLNPALSNLYHGTHQDNSDDADRHGTRMRGERHVDAKLTVDAVKEIRASSDTQRALAKKFGVTEGAIAHVIHGRNWKSVTDEVLP